MAQAKGLGVEVYLTKPMNPEALLKTINEMAGQSSQTSSKSSAASPVVEEQHPIGRVDTATLDNFYTLGQSGGDKDFLEKLLNVFSREAKLELENAN